MSSEPLFGHWNSGRRYRFSKGIAEPFLAVMRAVVFRDDGETGRRAGVDRGRQRRMHRNIDRHGAAALFRHQMRNAVADMLLAEPSRIATTQTEVQEHIEHQPLFAAERPALLELLDHLEPASYSEKACSSPSGNAAAQLPAIDVKSLHAKIGALTLENDFLEGALTKAGLLSAKR